MKKITIRFSFSFVFCWFLCYSNHSFSQDTQIKGFVNIDFGAGTDSSKNWNNNFHLGQYDWFVSSQVTDKITFLGESVFEHDGASFGVDVERVILKYTFNNYFKLSAGKYHTPLGFWNNAYHHGEVIQPTIGRPLCLKFEDEGGPLPIHETGISIDGSNISKANLGYNLLVSNGIGGTPITDNNTNKSVSGQIYSEPVENLRIFVSGLQDFVSANTVTLQGDLIPENTEYMILNGGFMYSNISSPLEIGGEYYSISTGQSTTGTKMTSAAYAYLGYKIKKCIPYFRYDMITYDDSSNYFTKNNLSALTFGLRYKMSAMSCLKLEYQMRTTDALKEETSVMLQFAIGF